MHKPHSHTLRSLMLLLLSIAALAVNATGASDGFYRTVSMQLQSNYACEMLAPEDEADTAMVDEGYELEGYECEGVEGVYDSVEGVSNSQIKDKDKDSEKRQMKVASEDLHGTYPYEAEGYENPIKKSTYASVVVSNPLNEKFSWKGLILPAGLVAAGVIGLETGLFKGRDDGDTEACEKDGTDFEDIAQYVPVAGYLTMGLIPGIEHKHSFVERSMAAVTAYGMMFLITKPVKHWVHERRPDQTSEDSFPSGHAATAFTGAELLRLEYGTWIGLGGYALATTVSALRIHHHRHWFNDVVAGAGVGILCARASYWLLPLERKLFGIKNPKVGVAAFPICNPLSRQFALGCCINF